MMTCYVQGAGIDEPLAQSRSGLSFYNADGLGSITSLTDSSGAPTGTFVYGAFGVLNSSTGTTANSYRYTAREYDQETELYYYRARYYDTAVGRFITEDPIGFDGGINFYSYVLNSPTNFKDPSGEVCIYSQHTGRLVCYSECRVVPEPNSCRANPLPDAGDPYYDETGYSGHGDGKNDPSAQDQPFVGPIPTGGWNMVGDWYDKKPRPGHNVINLKPLPGNSCFKTKRDCSTFRVHGDNKTHTASEGCVIQPPHRTDLVLNETIWVQP